MPRQLRKKNKPNQKKLRFVVGGKKFVLYFLVYLRILWVNSISPEGAGSARGSGQILKWRPSWSSPWEGKRQKFVACTRDTTELVGFAERFACSFHLCEFSQKPAPSIFSFVFKKVHFYQNFVWVCVENESPIFAGLLVTVSPRTRAPAY